MRVRFWIVFENTLPQFGRRDWLMLVWERTRHNTNDPLIPEFWGLFSGKKHCIGAKSNRFHGYKPIVDTHKAYRTLRVFLNLWPDGFWIKRAKIAFRLFPDLIWLLHSMHGLQYDKKTRNNAETFSWPRFLPYWSSKTVRSSRIRINLATPYS